MAQRLALHYLPGRSPLHLWDGRCKLVGLPLVTGSLLFEDPYLLLLPTILFIGLQILSGTGVRPVYRTFLSWLPILLLLFVVRAFTATGSVVRGMGWVPATLDSLAGAGLMCWRMTLIILYGVLFTAVTKPNDMRDALISLFRPVPLIPEKRVATMTTMTIRFFTILLDLIHEVRLANSARLGDRVRRPLRAIKCLMLPVIRRSLRRADDMALALAARGYREDVYARNQPVGLVQWIPLILYAAVLMALLCMRYKTWGL